MRKLRTFIQIHNWDNLKTLVKARVSRMERSSVAKMKFGILPIAMETERFSKNRPEPEERKCKLCNNGDAEDEAHLLFMCERHALAREPYLAEVYEDDPIIEYMANLSQLKILLQETRIRETTRWVDAIVQSRKECLYVKCN